MVKESDCWETPPELFKQLDKEFHFDIDLCATKQNSKCALCCTDYLKNTAIDYWEFNNDPLIEEDGNCYYGLLTYPNYTFKELVEECHIKTAFMNPPYSNPKPFIEKAWEDSKHCKIVCLVKVDPSTKWWSTFWNYEERIESYYNDRTAASRLIERGPKAGCEVRFLPKRVKFVRPPCTACGGDGKEHIWEGYSESAGIEDCKGCTGKKDSGPSFASCIVIMDRRGL